MSQFDDMLLRVEQLSKWTEELVTPKSIWLAGLFNPSSYLTAMSQVTARKTGTALDKMALETQTTAFASVNDVIDYAKAGTYVHGLFIEGACFDGKKIFGYHDRNCTGSGFRGYGQGQK